MASIITHQFRKAIAEAIYDDIFSRRNNYYYFFNRYPTADTIPSTPPNTIEYQTTVRNHIVAAKKIYVSDVAFVVPRFNWTSGTSYTKYNSLLNGIVTLASGPQFYVYDDVNYRVYKCINNNNGASSTVRPTSTEAFDVTYADGYIWRYMYTLPKSIRNKFLTGTHLPVFTALQKRYYSDGGLGEVTIIKSGANYTQATTTITVTGDGSGAVLEPVIVNGQLGDVIVKNPGRDYSRAVITVGDSGSGAGAEIVAELNTGDLDSDQALVELLTTPGTVDSVDVISGGAGYVTASIEVHGDGTGATAQAVITNGVITKIIVTNKGSDYSYAELEITGQALPNPPSAVASTRVNVSPFLGHGRNAIDELFADTLMFYGNIDSDRLSDFDVVTPYKQFGLIKNLRNLDYTSNIYDQVSPNRYQVEADFGPVVTFVGGGGTGAKGRVNVTGKYVSDIKIETAGAGYSSAPTLSFTGGGGGSGASATAKIKAKLNTATLTYGGVGYASAPGVTVSSITGSGGVVRATSAIGVGAVNITNQGTSYVSAPVVSFTGGTGTAATATAIISGGKVVKVVITSPGSYTVAPTGVTFAAGAGVTATGSVVTTYTTSALTIDKTGDNYETQPDLIFNGASGISDIVVNDPGALFTAGTGPALTFSGGGGNGLAATAYVDNCIRYITITNSGSGYTVAPTVSISGTGTGAAATAVISGGKVIGITITNRGSGYTGTPSVTFSAPSAGVTATATSVASLGITHINVTNPGTGYTSIPTVSVANNGTRTGFSLMPVLGKATGSVTIQGPLKSVTLTGNGTGYTSAPTVVLSGGSPTIAAVVYTKVVGSVTSITVDEGGSGYSSAPSVIISGGEGLAASFVANVSSGNVASCTQVKEGNNYVITKFADFTIGTLLIDEQLNEYKVYSAKTNKKDNSLIITSNNGTPVVGRMKIRKKGASDYFITNTALSQKFIESRFPVACYKVRGAFTLANFPAGTDVILTDQTNGNKKFIVISSKDFETGTSEMLLLPVDGGIINNGVTLTNGTNSFSVISYDEPALDRRTGELLMISNNDTSFTQNSDQTLSFRTIINF